MKTDLTVDFPPAVDGIGRAAITDPAEIAGYRALLAEHAWVDDPAADEAFAVLEKVTRFTRYLAGYAVMSAGEESDRVGLVLAGRCRVWTPDEPERTLGWLERGALIGEMSAVAGERRTATVGAVRDTVVAEVDAAALGTLDDPRAGLLIYRWIAQVMARRALGREVRRPQGMNLTVIADDPDVALGFARRLVAAGADADERWTLRTCADFPETPGVAEMEAVERACDYAVYVADRADRTWTAQVLRQADRVLVVADAAGDARLTAVDLAARQARAPHTLVLLQPADVAHATETARWLRDRRPAMHLHVRDGNRGDVARCMRLVTGRGRGLALAGASSRGMGYSGVLQALEELALAPDIVTGNSSGSMAAACLAMGFDSARTAEAYRAGFATMRPNRRTLTLPLVALMTGRQISRFLARTFGDVRLEDLIVPCVLTAVDLSSLALVEMRTGPVWRAVRASTSLPAYFPPVVVDGQVLVDGGVLDNLPVGALDGCCRNGFVLLGDLSQDPEGFSDMAPYGAELSGWRLLLRRLWPFGRRQRYPIMPEVLFRTACLASLRSQEQTLRHPPRHWLHARPDTPPIGLFGATDAQLPRLIEDTRRCTAELLAGSELPAVRAALAAGRGAPARPSSGVSGGLHLVSRRAVPLAG